MFLCKQINRNQLLNWHQTFLLSPLYKTYLYCSTHSASIQSNLTGWLSTENLWKYWNIKGPMALAVVKWAVVNNEAWQPTPKTRDIKVWTFSVRTSKHAFAPAFNKEVIKNDPLWTKISHRWWTQKLLLHALSYLTGQHPLKWRFDRSIV